MSKRLHQTVLALSLAMVGVGSAHAQLVIETGQSDRAAAPPTPTSPVKVSATPAPTRSGLVIVDGYDQPTAPAVKQTVVSPTTTTTVAAVPTPDQSVIEVGKRPAVMARPKGWADGVPMSVALRQIIPADFALRPDGVDTSALVSWSGDRPWNDILGTVARNAHVRAAILWDDKVVTLVPGDRPALTSVKSEETKSTRTTTTVVLNAPTAPVSSPSTVAVAPVQTWNLDPSKSLKENFEAWVKKAGWNKLLWEGADYPVYGPASFTGDFAAEDGPVATVIAAFEHSQKPLVVSMTLRDKVVHVYNKNFEPVEIQATSAAELAPEVLRNSGVDPSVTAPTSDAMKQGSQMAPINIHNRASSARGN